LNNTIQKNIDTRSLIQKYIEEYNHYKYPVYQAYLDGKIESYEYEYSDEGQLAYAEAMDEILKEKYNTDMLAELGEILIGIKVTK
jgi:hypothetical protein